MGKKKAFTKGNAKTVAKNIFKVAGAPQSKKKTKVVKTQIKKVYPSNICSSIIITLHIIENQSNNSLLYFHLNDSDPSKCKITAGIIRSPIEVIA